MIFHFIKSFGYYNTPESFKMDIPVNFVIPDKFKSFDELGVLSSYNKEVRDILKSIGVTNRIIHYLKITKDEVIVSLKLDDYESVKKVLLRDKLLKELGI